MRLLFEPLDTYLFRDSRPFSPQEMARAQSVTLAPTGSTLFGAVRHLFLEELGVTYNEYQGADFHRAGQRRTLDPQALAAFLGSTDRAGSIAIRGPFLRAGSEVLLTSPADVTKVSDGECAFYLPSKGARPQSNLPTECARSLAPRIQRSERWTELPLSTTPPGDGTEWAVSVAHTDQLGMYLCCRATTILKRLSEYVSTEVHTGIERDHSTYRPKTGMLYAVEFQRTRPGDTALSFLVDVNASPELEQAVFPPAWSGRVVTMGGERRPFRVTRDLAPFPWEDPALREQVRKFLDDHGYRDGRLHLRLCLLTAGAFERGWLPDLFGSRGEWRLDAAAVPKPLYLSGYDISSNSPRPARPFVPAGAVYFVSRACESTAKSAAIEEALSLFWARNMLATCQTAAQQGWALSLVGGYPDVQ